MGAAGALPGVTDRGCGDEAGGDVAGAAAATVVGKAAVVSVETGPVSAPGAAGGVSTDVGEGLAALPDVGFAVLVADGTVAPLKAGSEFGGSTGKASQNHPIICIPGQLSVPVWAS
jgi:hypothetical protein